MEQIILTYIQQGYIVEVSNLKVYDTLRCTDKEGLFFNLTNPLTERTAYQYVPYVYLLKDDDKHSLLRDTLKSLKRQVDMV